MCCKSRLILKYETLARCIINALVLTDFAFLSRTLRASQVATLNEKQVCHSVRSNCRLSSRCNAIAFHCAGGNAVYERVW